MNISKDSVENTGEKYETTCFLLAQKIIYNFDNSQIKIFSPKYFERSKNSASNYLVIKYF